MKIQMDQEGVMAVTAVCDLALRGHGMRALMAVNRVMSNTKVDQQSEVKPEEPSPEQ